MAIGIRTVAINAAFLQEIKDDSHELRQLMHHTSAMLDHSGPVEIEYPRLAELFGKLRDQLAMHFSLEEAYGYFDDALTAAPHLSNRAERLRSQHFGLFKDLGRLVESAEALLYHEKPATALPRLAAEYRRFQVRFHEHETQESDLIQEAFNEDIGAGD